VIDQFGAEPHVVRPSRVMRTMLIVICLPRGNYEGAARAVTGRTGLAQRATLEAAPCNQSRAVSVLPVAPGRAR